MHRKISELERVMYAVCISPLIIRSAFLLALRTLKAAQRMPVIAQNHGSAFTHGLPATAIKL